MKEKNFQSEFKNKNEIFGAFELKLCKGASIGFKALAPHQRQALIDISGSITGLYHKISDSPFFRDGEGRMRFTKPKPFDCFLLKTIDAYVVVMFYVPRKKKNVYYIHIFDFLEMETEANRKSFTEEMAQANAAHSVSFLKERG